MALSKAWEIVRGIPTVIDVVGNTVTFDIGGVTFPPAPGSQGDTLKMTSASAAGWGAFNGLDVDEGEALAITLG